MKYYDDFVTATPEVMLTCMLNVCVPGCGTCLSAFYCKKGAPNNITFWYGMAQTVCHMILVMCIPAAHALAAFMIIMCVAHWCSVQLYSFACWRKSKEEYFPELCK